MRQQTNIPQTPPIRDKCAYHASFTMLYHRIKHQRSSCAEKKERARKEERRRGETETRRGCRAGGGAKFEEGACEALAGCNLLRRRVGVSVAAPPVPL